MENTVVMVENTNWLTDNPLALYAAIVGTLALLLNLSKFWHDLTKSKFKMRIHYSKVPDYDKNIQALSENEDVPAYDRISIAAVYLVTVTNTGNVDINIGDVGVITNNGQRISALVNANPTNLMLSLIDEKNTSPIPAKSSKCYSIYLKRGQAPFTVSKIFVVDALGKEWKSSKFT